MGFKQIYGIPFMDFIWLQNGFCSKITRQRFIM
jgi:hypothetical protein